MHAVPEPIFTPTQRAVYDALVEARGRPVGRRQLARRAGLLGTSERRCDAVVVELRRALGHEAIVTIRGRGWALAST